VETAICTPFAALPLIRTLPCVNSFPLQWFVSVRSNLALTLPWPIFNSKRLPSFWSSTIPTVIVKGVFSFNRQIR